MSDEYLIKYLNEQLSVECEAIIRYLYCSALVQDEEVKKSLEIFIKEELKDAQMLINFIVSLGRKPVFRIPEINPGKDILRILVKSIAAEESAAKKYRMIESLLDKPGHKKIIKETIKLEENHHKKLEEILARLKKLYKDSRAEK